MASSWSIGCGESAAPSCEATARHAAKFATYELTEEDVARKVRLCTDKKWSAEFRRCAVAARSNADLERCEPPRKKEPSEAQVQLGSIQKRLEAHYAEHAAFPVGTSGPIPATPCCEGTDRKCDVDPALWHGTSAAPSVWDALEFVIDDRTTTSTRIWAPPRPRPSRPWAISTATARR